MLPPVKIRKTRTPKVEMPAPPFPVIHSDEGNEILSGEVRGYRASKAEERLANALDKKGISYYFRYTLGAPRGLSGWFEIDFVIQTQSMVYAVEVDSEFTHETKKEKDRLHDAKALQELKKFGNLFPQVIHIDGEADLADMKTAEDTVSRLFV